MIYSMQSKDGTQSLKAEATKETRDAVLANFAEQVKWFDTEPVGGRVEHHHYDVIEHASHAEHASGDTRPADRQHRKAARAASGV